jgi:hypothetical protein
MKQRYENDDRLYSRFKPNIRSRFFVQCLAELPHGDDPPWFCKFTQREDDFRRNLRKGLLHKCVFKPPSGLMGGQMRLEDLTIKLSPPKSPLLIDIAIFLSKANVSVQSVCNHSFRALLQHAFELGWQSRADSTNRGVLLDQIIKTMIPSMNPDTINKALNTAHKHSRSELVDIFSQYKYVGLSIDGVTIKSRKFLNIDVVNPISDTLPFTYDFFQNNSFDTVTFVDKFCELLACMESERLCPSGVTSDGCAFQVKALSWRDDHSVQARGEQFSKLLFAPCICHRLQNAIISLYKENMHYRALIEQVREAAIILRKPRARAMIGAICPAHCPTRWIYDYQLVRFLTNNYEQANNILISYGLYLSPQINLLIPLLEKTFDTMRVFEADDAPLACVVPEITDLLSSLQHYSHSSRCQELEDIYMDAISIIRRKCLMTVNFIFHLAYVLTPAGRTMARNILLERTVTEIESPEKIEEEIEDHMTCAGLTSRYDKISSDEEDQDMLETEEEDTEKIPLESMAETDIFEDDDDENAGDTTSSERPLHHEAEEGLREILLQFRLDEGVIDEVIGSFQNFITVAPTDLFIKPIPKKNRYAWGVSQDNEQVHETLSDIAQRLEAMVCNEAVTERTNSTMKRILSPFRLRMSSDILLSRLTIARHGNIEPAKGDNSVDPVET